MTSIISVPWGGVLFYFTLFSFSPVASSQRVKEEGALLWASCCLHIMLRGCQICWAFRSKPGAEQLLQFPSGMGHKWVDEIRQHAFLRRLDRHNCLYKDESGVLGKTPSCKSEVEKIFH